MNSAWKAFGSGPGNNGAPSAAMGATAERAPLRSADRQEPQGGLSCWPWGPDKVISRHPSPVGRPNPAGPFECCFWWARKAGSRLPRVPPGRSLLLRLGPWLLPLQWGNLHFVSRGARQGWQTWVRPAGVRGGETGPVPREGAPEHNGGGLPLPSLLHGAGSELAN